MIKIRTRWVQNLFIKSSVTFKLISDLSSEARQAYLVRDYARLKTAGERLISLSPEAESLGRYYVALATDRESVISLEKARKDFESLIDTSIIPVRCAAMIGAAGADIARGVISQHTKELLLAASEMALKDSDILNFTRAQSQISLLLSLAGNHRGSLEILRGIQPAVEKLSTTYNIVKADYYNSTSYELSKLGDSEAAKRFAIKVIKSPHLSSYPEWQQNLKSIFVDKPSVVNTRPTLQPIGKLIRFPVKITKPKVISVLLGEDDKIYRYGQCPVSELASLRKFLAAKMNPQLQRNTDNATK